MNYFRNSGKHPEKKSGKALQKYSKKKRGDIEEVPGRIREEISVEALEKYNINLWEENF